MTLIAVDTSEGCIGRCDAKCYTATEPECDRICGGANHGAGLAQAVDNTRQYAEVMIEKYAGGKLVDVAEIIEVVLCKLRDSTRLGWMIEDAIEDPHADVTRPNVHVSELLKMGRAVLEAVAIAVDEQVSTLDVVED